MEASKGKLLAKDSITVIIPVHNSAKTLGTALKSTLMGLSDVDRIHVFLDNCRDNSMDVLNSLSDKRVSVIGKSDEKLGVKSALNNLLQSVETPLVARMDADDVSFPWRFRFQRELISRADIVFSTAIVFGAQLKPLPVLPQYPVRLNGFSAKASLIFANPFVHPSMTARTSVLLDLDGYREEFGQDHGLWLRAAISGVELRRMALPCLAYRFHSKQVSASRRWLEMKELDQQIPALQQQLETNLCLEYGLAGRESILEKLYKEVPALRLEHKGLPSWLRRFKNAHQFTD
jgi:glycosyltransferase involved in cell wall biosynthesis